MKNTNNRRSGFTLIELLISLGIITLMSGLLYAGLNSVKQAANDSRRNGDLKNVQGYLETYHLRCGHYPGDKDCGADTPANWGALGTALSGITGINRLPYDPVSGAPYSYWPSPDGSNYVLGATLQTDNKSILKESYDGTDGNGYGSDCNKAALKYCIHS